ncbi:hypothetical protein OC188_00300 [Anaplasma capra]|uniref:hypothetical protein n=1 Tax=Anaplasma capra TaxID=1562740 RepID=UPI0021D6159A|nr:hypothetical protein [Anaplasma capra]MCU7611153.1 hypothetical protein [Anaplasma capra]
MIYFDDNKFMEAFSNGGIYVHSDPHWGHRFINGEITEGVFTIDYLAPIEFRRDGAAGAIIFESVVDPKLAGLSYIVPEGTDSFRDCKVHGSFKYTDYGSAELLNMSYGERYYTYKAQNGGGQLLVGRLAEPGGLDVTRNGFSILAGPTRGAVLLGDNTAVFQVPVSDSQVLDVILYPPQHVFPVKGEVRPTDKESREAAEHFMNTDNEASQQGRAEPSGVQSHTPDSGLGAETNLGLGAVTNGDPKPAPGASGEVPSEKDVTDNLQPTKNGGDVPLEELRNADKSTGWHREVLGWLKSFFT